MVNWLEIEQITEETKQRDVWPGRFSVLSDISDVVESLLTKGPTIGDIPEFMRRLHPYTRSWNTLKKIPIPTSPFDLAGIPIGGKDEAPEPLPIEEVFPRPPAQLDLYEVFSQFNELGGTEKGWKLYIEVPRVAEEAAQLGLEPHRLERLDVTYIPSWEELAATALDFANTYKNRGWVQAHICGHKIRRACILTEVDVPKTP